MFSFFNIRPLLNSIFKRNALIDQINQGVIIAFKKGCLHAKLGLKKILIAERYILKIGSTVQIYLSQFVGSLCMIALIRRNTIPCDG